MKKSKNLQWGAVLFLVLASLFLAYQRLHKPRIFIVHSYHPQMPWVISLNQGVAKVFADKAYIDLRYFYMDTKHKSAPRFLRHIQHAISNTIHRWKPDVVIAFDSDAQNVMSNLLQEGLNCKVIFAGITNEQRLSTFSKSTNITGITENIPVLAIREILSLIFRDRRKIYYLSDDSSAAKSLDKAIVRQQWGSYQLVAHQRVTTVQDWKKAVLKAQKEADILLVSLYHTLREGKTTVNRKNLVRWMNQNSKIPVVGLYESFMIDGGLLAIAISSLEQGLTAAQMALQVVEKKVDIKELPVQQGKTFSLFIDKPELKKRFLSRKIPMILDTFARSHRLPGAPNS